MGNYMPTFYLAKHGVDLPQTGGQALTLSPVHPYRNYPN